MVQCDNDEAMHVKTVRQYNYALWIKGILKQSATQLQDQRIIAVGKDLGDHLVQPLS